MPNIAAVLKDEIRRLARKEVKSQVGQTRKLAAAHRREIAGLKRLLAKQAAEIKSLQKRSPESEKLQSTENELESIRFSARSVKAQRQRLGLSAADYGRLIGVSGLTIYAWESGKNRPRKAQLAALVAARGIGKREALTKLAEVLEKKPRRRKGR